MYFFNYLKFLISATNQHGVHSPFVYAFVTKCVYHKKKYTREKSVNLLLKTLEYFKISSVNISDLETKAWHQILENHPSIKFDTASTDFWYIASLHDEQLLKLMFENKFQNDSIVFIDAIFKDNKAWEALLSSEKIVVSINLFYCGILFFRKEQVKEDFKIRL